MLKDDKHQATTSPKKEDNTDSDKKGILSWNNYSDYTRMRTHHVDKRKNQVTTTAEKEDDTVVPRNSGHMVSQRIQVQFAVVFGSLG